VGNEEKIWEPQGHRETSLLEDSRVSGKVEGREIKGISI